MKKIFIYYSMNGSGDLVANFMKENGYDIRKVIPKNKYPKKMFPLMMTGGFKALFKLKDKLINFDKDINKYDKIVIGSPIWFDRVSAPINRVLSELDLYNKDVSFILYSASGEANKASLRLKELGDITILKEPKKYKEELNKIRG